MTRDELIAFICENDESYRNEDFSAYSDRQLLLIKVRIEVEKEKQREEKGAR